MASSAVILNRRQFLALNHVAVQKGYKDAHEYLRAVADAAIEKIGEAKLEELYPKGKPGRPKKDKGY